MSESRLDKFRTLISNMSDDELKAKVLEIRGSRKVNKRAQRTVTKKVRTAAKDTIATLAASMTDEERAALKAVLMKGK